MFRITDLPGIAKQICEVSDVLCGRSVLSIVWFTGVRGYFYSGTVAAQGSSSIPECAFTNEEYMYIYLQRK